VLKAVGALPDTLKARDSKALRAGKGKMRNRRYVLRKGPLVIFASDNGVSRAFRNLPGVEVASVDRLNLLQVSVGGGRTVQWGGRGCNGSPWGGVSMPRLAALGLEPSAQPPPPQPPPPRPPFAPPTGRHTHTRPSPHPSQLAPGGHLGRFCVWTKSAFEALDKVFGTADAPSASKKGYTLPRPMMANADVARLINSDEVQSVVRPPKEAAIQARPLKKNPLKNLGALVKLNPHAIVTRRNAVLAAERRGKARAEKLEKLRAGKPSGAAKKSKEQAAIGKAFYKQMVRHTRGWAAGRPRAAWGAAPGVRLRCRRPKAPQPLLPGPGASLTPPPSLRALPLSLPPPLRSSTLSTRARTTRCSPSGWAPPSKGARPPQVGGPGAAQGPRSRRRRLRRGGLRARARQGAPRPAERARVAARPVRM
jgi:hypothetical protein